MAQRAASTSTDSLLSLVNDVYAAAEDATLWPSFLTSFADAMHSSLTTFFVQDLRSAEANITLSVRFDTEFAHLYDEYYCRKNVWLLSSRERMDVGVVLPSQQMLPDEELVTTEYYADFLQPQGVFHGCGGVIAKNDDVVARITTLRAKNCGPYEKPELDLLRNLIPHLQRAFRLHHEWSRVKSTSGVAAEALDKLGMALLVCDDGGTIRFASRKAEELLAKRDGLESREGKLTTSAGIDESLLASAIDTVLKTEQRVATASVDRPSGECPLDIVVTRTVQTNSLIERPRPTIAVIVRNLEVGLKLDIAALERLYQITPAEARLASELVAGRTVKETAQRCGLSPHTVRSQLKQLLQKTETHRQVDLVRLLSRLAVPT